MFYHTEVPDCGICGDSRQCNGACTHASSRYGARPVGARRTRPVLSRRLTSRDVTSIDLSRRTRPVPSRLAPTCPYRSLTRRDKSEQVGQSRPAQTHMCTPLTAVRPPSVSSPDELVFHLRGCHAVIISITDDLKDIGIIWEDAEHAAEDRSMWRGCVARCAGGTRMK